MLVFAADRTFLRELQFLAETLDIGFVHLAERRRDIGRRCRIALQLLKRHQDLVGPALDAVQIHLFGFGGHALAADQALVKAGIETADVAQRPRDIRIDCLPIGVAVEQGHLANLLVE